MNILLIDVSAPLAQALAGMGHKIEEVRPPRGIVFLPRILKRLSAGGFVPDILVQQESLGPRLYLAGLDKAPCPSLFFAVDSHLNLFWQQWYSLLFDGVLTPHLSLFADLPEECRPLAVSRFAWFGQGRQWRPHEKRGRFMSLCARRTEHRPLREWFVELLSQRGLECVEGLKHSDMMLLYDDSRLVPNECIAWESNFRLLEAASAGCCVLSPDVGEDQNALLEPGREILVWQDGFELLDRVAWAKMRPERAEKIGRAAFARVNASHLPAHRAGSLLGAARGLSLNRLEGPPARLAFWLTVAKQVRNGALRINAREHAAAGLRLLEALPAWERLPNHARSLVSHSLAQCLILLALSPGSADEALRLCRSLAAEGAHARGGPAAALEVASAASALALREGDHPLARFFWMFWQEKSLAGAGTSGSENKRRDALKSPVELCCGWAAALHRRGRIAQTGFAFRPEEGALPECSLEFLRFAGRFIPEGPDGNAARKRLHNMELDMTEAPVHLVRHLNALDALSRLEPENWRVSLVYGAACIKACLVEEGVCV
ncbi:MAG: glycosyltransferase, partial [Desulfovibrio sp.]|nr:glycosyltransferase [Desulfovibrio sp.]